MNIIKKVDKGNIGDYEEACLKSTWDEVKSSFDWSKGGVLNVAHEAIDRHVENRGNKVALYWEGLDGRREKYTFLQIKLLTNRFANILKKYGIVRGDRFATLLPRLPSLYVSHLGAAKAGAVVVPLFEGFAVDAVRYRIMDSGAKMVMTTPELAAKVSKVWEEFPDLRYVVILHPNGERELVERTLREPGGKILLHYADEMKEASDKFEVQSMKLEDPWIIYYTSGTTGRPKGVVNAHRSMLTYRLNAYWQMDLREDDILWVTADPSWATWGNYGVAGWVIGGSNIAYVGRFDAEKWYSILEYYRVTVFFTPPTAWRLLKLNERYAKERDLSSLRHLLSAGEPLSPELVSWSINVFGIPIHDGWGQSETSGCPIANLPSMPIKPGSMGRTMPLARAAVVDGEGREVPPKQVGMLALDPRWPGLLTGVWNNEAKYREYFRIPGWYLSGDLAYMDEDGYFWFVSRINDLIKSGGIQVGTFEVESVLIEHPAVAEAAVVGKPDPIRGEIVKALIVLKDGYAPSEELEDGLMQFVKDRLGSYARPREVEFMDSLPKTISGKILRRNLRARELGVPLGELEEQEAV